MKSGSAELISFFPLGSNRYYRTGLCLKFLHFIPPGFILFFLSPGHGDSQLESQPSGRQRQESHSQGQAGHRGPGLQKGRAGDIAQ